MSTATYPTSQSLLEPTIDGSQEQLLEISMGPQHPSTHGVFRMNVVLDGENVVKLKPVFGYLHRNHEKIAENETYLGSMPGAIIRQMKAAGVINPQPSVRIVRETDACAREFECAVEKPFVCGVSGHAGKNLPCETEMACHPERLSLLRRTTCNL